LEVETSLQRTFKAVWRGAMGLNEMPSHRVALSIPKDAYSESFAGTTTVYNWREACYVSWVVDSLLKHEPTEGQVKIQPANITVNTPYAGQEWWLRRVVPDEVEVASINKFQGRENQIIIFSMVKNAAVKEADKAKPPTDIGWIADPRRLCVALSRAKGILCIVGAFAAWEKRVPFWNGKGTYQAFCSLVSDLRKKKLIHFPPKARQSELLAAKPIVRSYLDAAELAGLVAGHEEGEIM